MRLILITLSLVFVAACTPTQKVEDTAPPALRVSDPAPVLVSTPAPEQPRFRMETILGLETSSVEKILGKPSLKRVERDAEVWLYDNQFCNAHVYFYENDNSDLNVEFIEASEEKNMESLDGQHADFCISTFLQD